MGKQLRINGQTEEVEEHEEDKTVKQLKQEAGIPADNPMTYNDGDATYELADQDTVEHIPDGATVAPLPDSGRLFG